MATMVSEVYDRFVEPGASQDKGRKAAEAVANYDTRFNVLEQKLTLLQGDVNLLKWIGGVVVGGVVATVLKLYLH